MRSDLLWLYLLLLGVYFCYLVWQFSLVGFRRQAIRAVFMRKGLISFLILLIFAISAWVFRMLWFSPE